MQMPPGSASASRSAATLTPSPKMSPSSTMTSPRLHRSGTGSGGPRGSWPHGRPSRVAARRHSAPRRRRSGIPPTGRRRCSLRCGHGAPRSSDRPIRADAPSGVRGCLPHRRPSSANSLPHRRRGWRRAGGSRPWLTRGSRFSDQFILKLSKVPRLLVGQRRRLDAGPASTRSPLGVFLAATRRSRPRYGGRLLLPWAFSARPN